MLLPFIVIHEMTADLLNNIYPLQLLAFLLVYLLKKRRKVRCLNITLRRHLALVFLLLYVCDFLSFFSYLFMGWGVTFFSEVSFGVQGLTKWFSCSLEIKHKRGDYFE